MFRAMGKGQDGPSCKIKEKTMPQTAAKITDYSASDFRIGSALSKSFEILFRHVLSFSLMSVIAWLPVFAMAIVGALVIAPASEQAAGAAPDPAVLAKFGAAMLGSLLWALIFFPVTFAVILHIAFQDMRGRSANLGEGFRRGFARLLPMLVIFLLTLIGVFLGLILLVVPGVIVALMWYVAMPVCVVERTGPLRSLGRSRELTKGYRWKLLGLVIIAAVGGMLASLVPQVLLAPVPAVQSIVVLIVDILGSAFSTVLLVVIYHDLRVAKEGVDIEGIASVFD